MHPEISSFSRKEFYEDKALIDADTLLIRESKYPFEYRNNQSRSTWIDVPSGGINEVHAIKFELEQFIEYARKNRPTNPRRDNTAQWEVALLSLIKDNENSR